MSAIIVEGLRLSQTHQRTWSQLPTVAELFVQQARETPERTAVVASDGTRTYSELLVEATCIAARLREFGVGPDVPVALLVERSIATISALWGILLAGGAYMPLEPSAPPAYITRQLEESRVSLLIAARRMSDTLPEFKGKVLCLDDLLKYKRPPFINDPVAVEPEHLAYVITTSGSTGIPKAVGVVQGGIANYTSALSDQLQLREQATNDQCNFAIVSTLAADLGNTCLFPALTTGACLHLVSSDLILDGQAFADYMTKNRIDVLKIVPSHLRALLSQGVAVLPQRWLIVGGETFPADLLDQIRDAGARCRVINHYGPTETTVGSLMNQIADNEEILMPPVLSVGLPILNSEAYVLDEAMLPAPADVVGELYIGGAGLARGYLFRPDITADRFVPNPFSSRPGQRLYRTGDRALQRFDGRIQVLGRTDGQVKIRGHRVELEEVESALRHHPDVESAAAAVIEEINGGKHLVAYLSGKPECAKDSADLRSYLAAELPPAMIPSDFVWVEALPLTPNGKLDRKKLVTLRSERESPLTDEPPPSSPIEAKIAGIWAQVLGREQVGTAENFFEMGGDSIAAIHITARLRKQGVSITPLQLFKYPTVAGLAAIVKPAAPEPRPSPAPTEAAASSSGKDEPYTLSPLQQGMLFHSLNSSGERLYVSELVCTFREGFDPDAFTYAWQCVVDRHSIFRTAFRWEDEIEPLQIALARVVVNIERFDWSYASPSEQQRLLSQYCEDVYRAGIDLRVAPLMRMALIRLGSDRYQFAWIYHHLLMDAWSEAILSEELFAHYNAFRNGQECIRPAIAPYRAYVEWLSSRDQSQAERFWRGYLRGFRKPTPVVGAIESSLPMIAPSAWDMTQLLVRDVEARRLWELARARQLTLNTLAQAGWALVLGEYTGMDDVVFGATVAGRPADLPGSDRMIGPFLNTVPVRVRMPREITVTRWLAQIQREQAEAREYEHSPLVQVQAWSELARGTSLFESFIGFQNASLSRVGMADDSRSSSLFPIQTRSFRGGWTNYPLSLDIEPSNEILLTLSFDKERVTQAAARGLLACLKSALSLFASAPDESLAQLRQSLTALRREHITQQQRGFVEAQRSRISSLRRRG